MNFFKRFKKVKKQLNIPNIKKMPRWKAALYYSLYGLIGLVFILVISFAWFAKDLPTPSKIANRKATESTKIYDRTGQTLLYETGDQKRTIVQSDQISQYLKDATVSTEDANFYKHHGFDLRAIAGSIYGKIAHKTNKTRGASTITQQYVKNSFLTSDRSMIRKFKELILSVELEFMFNKDEILTMYLNEIPYGNSTAGAEAASKMYFGKPAKDLTLAEATTLAGIPQAPTYYSPYGTHTKELVNRKNYVLDRMVETGKVSREDADAAKGVDTLALNTSLKPRRDSMLAPHFSMYVLEQAANEYGDDAIQKNGLKIITTLDYEKQKVAEQSVTEGMPKIIKAGGTNTAMVAVDPKTGQILAMVGSRDYFDTTIDGNVNVADSLRQPGSSFKPFEYSTLLKKKEYSPSSVIFDLQTDFGGGYIPKNYNGRFNGPVTMRHALANSLNIPAIKVMALAGMDNTIRTAEDLGITTLNDHARYGLSLAIGVGEVKPVEMAGAFGVFGNGGIKNDLTPIMKVTEADGKVLYDYEKDHKEGSKVLDPQIAYEISDMLKDNNARSGTFGSRSALYFPDREVAVKTGTTQDDKDAWTVGYTPSIAVAVWSGNNQPKAMKSGGEALSGPIFHSFIVKALANVPNEPFQKPDGIQTITVDKFSNKLPTDLSTEKTTDIFASWQVPTEPDNIHIKVRVCKVNGKLAPDGLPETMSEDKIFTNLHSEMPDNPNWENPVIAWAQANGMSNNPPKDYCNASDLTPTLSFATPGNNAAISGEYTLSVTASASPAVKSVEYFIDDVSIGTGDTASANFTKKYNFDNLSSGQHRISAVGTDENSTTVKSSIVITTSQNVKISGLKEVNKTINSITIEWSTNVSANSKVTYSKTANDPHPTSGPSGAASTTHSLKITGLTGGTTYYYTVTSEDTNGSSDTAEGSFKTL